MHNKYNILYMQHKKYYVALLQGRGFLEQAHDPWERDRGGGDGDWRRRGSGGESRLLAMEQRVSLEFGQALEVFFFARNDQSIRLLE